MESIYPAAGQCNVCSLPEWQPEGSAAGNWDRDSSDGREDNAGYHEKGKQRPPPNVYSER
ncbi:uncharacterized protein Dsimw501_GD27692 [Drosophila simulans]|nr:uncharacterized protein Dsimw501_GD27692 [Drosophila simulans]